MELCGTQHRILLALDCNLFSLIIIVLFENTCWPENQCILSCSLKEGNHFNSYMALWHKSKRASLISKWLYKCGELTYPSRVHYKHS